MKTKLFSLRGSLSAVLLTMSLVFCFAFNCFATTWYISPSGNDTTGDGTIVLPWKTLYKATQTVTTFGDTIHVHAGTYIETEQCFLSIGVSLEGEGITSIIQSTLTTIFTELLTLRSAEGTNGNQHISNLKFDGQNLSTYWCIWIGGRSNVSIYNCTFTDFKDRGIIFGGRNDFTEAPPDSVYATGNKFYNNIVNNCAAYNDSVTGIYGRGALNIGGQDGMLIYNNTITQNQRPEGYNGWPIKYMNHGHLKNCKIYNNTLTKIPYGGSFPGESGWDFCIELFNIEGLEIKGNIIQGSIDLNFNRKGNSAYSAWIHHNIMSRDSLNTKYESGIIFEFGTETAIVEYNILNNVSSGVQFNTRDSSIVSDCKIRKNLFSNLGMGDSTGAQGGGIMIVSEGTNSAIITNLFIDNNTIIAATNREPWFGINFNSLAHGFATNVNIRNNIVIGFFAAWLHGGDTTNMDIVLVAANDAYNNGNGNAPSWPGGEPTNYFYDYFIGVDPLFNPATNFCLQAISPVIDLGVPVGLPFLGAAPDLGYAEFGGGPPLPVKLLEFYVKKNSGKNLLQWTTSTENNSDYFNIERSNNAQSFETIGRVKASGFSSSAVKYNFTDADPLKGINYYRLAMIDKDGRLEYSKIISISAEVNHNIDITYIDLSSATNRISLSVNSTKMQKADLSIIDISGRTIFISGLLLQKGSNTITKSIPALSKGIYYVKLFTADETIIKNVVNRN